MMFIINKLLQHCCNNIYNDNINNNYYASAFSSLQWSFVLDSNLSTNHCDSLDGPGRFAWTGNPQLSSSGVHKELDPLPEGIHPAIYYRIPITRGGIKRRLLIIRRAIAS